MCWIVQPSYEYETDVCFGCRSDKITRAANAHVDYPMEKYIERTTGASSKELPVSNLMYFDWGDMSIPPKL